MTGIPLAAQAAAAAAAEAAIDAAVHPFGRPLPGVDCDFGGIGVVLAFASCGVDDADGADVNAGEGKIADEIEPKLVSDDEMGDR